MKNITLLIIFLTSVIISGCNSSTNNTLGENLNFDTKISYLNYSLPQYTKICTPEVKQYCNADGCKKIKPTVFVLYDEMKEKIYRCDNNQCDGYQAEVSQSGLFTNIEPITPSGFAVKISKNNEYMESVSLWLETYISFGKCSNK